LSERTPAGLVGLRPLRMRDAAAWSEVRVRNEAWLAPWEPTSRLPWRERNSVAVYGPMVRALRKQARAGLTLPFAVTLDDVLVGQLTLGNIVRGSFQSAYAGYWVDGRVAGRGVMTWALAMAVDHAFGDVRLHRVEVNIRPENEASRRVVAKLGFREEGYHPRYLDIGGGWRDHVGYALTVEDVPEGLRRRLRR